MKQVVIEAVSNGWIVRTGDPERMFTGLQKRYVYDDVTLLLNAIVKYLFAGRPRPTISVEDYSS